MNNVDLSVNCILQINLDYNQSIFRIFFVKQTSFFDNIFFDLFFREITHFQYSPKLLLNKIREKFFRENNCKL